MVTLDFVGNTIGVGDEIVYAGRSGSRLTLTQATVLKVKDGKLLVKAIRVGTNQGVTNPYTSEVWLRNLGTVRRTRKAITV